MKPFILLPAFLLCLLVHASLADAGPVEGPIVLKQQLPPGKPLELRWKFKGGERAGVMVKEESKEPNEVFIEISDAKGQVITRDDQGGNFAAVIWHPPVDAMYIIKISAKAKQSSKCYIVIR